MTVRGPTEVYRSFTSCMTLFRPNSFLSPKAGAIYALALLTLSQPSSVEAMLPAAAPAVILNSIASIGPFAALLNPATFLVTCVTLFAGYVYTQTMPNADAPSLEEAATILRREGIEPNHLFKNYDIVPVGGL